MLECHQPQVSAEAEKRRRAEGSHGLQLIWDELAQNSINKAVLSLTKRLRE